MFRKNLLYLLIPLTLAILACKTLLGVTPPPPVIPSPTETVQTSSPETPVTVQATPPAPDGEPDEGLVTEISMKSPITDPQAEISGLAWYGDMLILLPQFPEQFARENDGALFTIPKSEILAYLQGENPAPLEPTEIPLATGCFEEQIPVYDGLEAITFLENQVFLSIEARDGASYSGFLIKGEIAPDFSMIQLDPESLAGIHPQVAMINKSEEAIFIADEMLALLPIRGLRKESQRKPRRCTIQSRSVRNWLYPLPKHRIPDYGRHIAGQPGALLGDQLFLPW
jgi:hypothetical protein